jgi:hypothetical protein
MKVAQVVISGFRGVKEGVVSFSGNNVLVGENGSGKSTIVDALWLAVARSPLARELTEHDFHGSTPSKADRFRIVVTLTGFDGDDPDDHGEWFRKGRGVPVWWDVRTRKVLPERAEAQQELACQVGYAARFDHENLEVETRRYFHDDDGIEDIFCDEVFVPFPPALLDDIGFFVLPAARTREHLSSFGSYLFRRAVSARGGIPAAGVVAERDRLRSPLEPFESHEALKELVGGMNQRLGALFSPGPTIHLRLTDTDSAGVLSAVVPHYAKGVSCCLPATRHGTGLLSLQALLLLLEIGEARLAAGGSFILAMEEPEMHLPPGIQRRLLFEAQRVASQVLCTTHSPRVAGFYAPTDVRLVQCTSGSLRAPALRTEPLPSDATNAIRKLFQDTRAQVIEAMMYPYVVVTEGRIDSDWLRLLSDVTETSDALATYAKEALPPFGAMIGVVAAHTAAVTATVQELSSLHPAVVPLVDGDSAGDGYVKELMNLQHPPPTILRWKEGWSIEDVVGWVFEAQKGEVLSRVSASIGKSFSTPAELVSELRRDTRDGGLKGDLVAYEAMASAIRDDEGCARRAAGLLLDVAGAIREPAASKFDASREIGVSTVVRLPA